MGTLKHPSKLLNFHLALSFCFLSMLILFKVQNTISHYFPLGPCLSCSFISWLTMDTFVLRVDHTMPDRRISKKYKFKSNWGDNSVKFLLNCRPIMRSNSSEKWQFSEIFTCFTILIDFSILIFWALWRIPQNFVRCIKLNSNYRICHAFSFLMFVLPSCNLFCP